MAFPEIRYQWQWELQSTPEELWPLVADTNRFDRDTGVPPLKRLDPTNRLNNARLQFRQSVFGIPLDYVIEPYEWVYPTHYGVKRYYKRGPLAELNVQVHFEAKPTGGTLCTYDVGVRARNLPGFIGIPVQIGTIFRQRFERTFRSYDRMVASRKPVAATRANVEFAPGGRDRLAALTKRLIDEGSEAGLVAHLRQMIETADSLELSRMRPYEMADKWGANRRTVLEMCLSATRASLLQFQWDLLCPMCRNARATSTGLDEIQSQVHCDTCNIDFTANFERSVELTFCPVPTIRPVDRNSYCIGGPLDTPHVVVQQLLADGETRTFATKLEAGRYRIRVLERGGGQFVQANPQSAIKQISAIIPAGDWPIPELEVHTDAEVTIENQSGAEQLLILERMVWTDQAATAAEVIVLQRFRDLFANEALRPGQHIAVGSLAVLFTDLRESTRMYNEIGDAPAFGLVMTHFDVLRAEIAAESGSIVKTIGDAVMGVFPRPAAALRAILNSQRGLELMDESPVPLRLKAGLHFGPCIAVTLNERLDYFGSTVNYAARLEGQSAGQDVVISEIIFEDPEVQALLAEVDNEFYTERVETTLKGFGDQRFGLYRLMRKPVSEPAR